MSKEQDYRKNAAQTVDLANRAETSTDKGHLLALAEKWLDLADRANSWAANRPRRPKDHPLVRAKLAKYQLDAE